MLKSPSNMVFDEMLERKMANLLWNGKIVLDFVLKNMVSLNVRANF